MDEQQVRVAYRMWFGEQATVQQIANETGAPIDEVQSLLAGATWAITKGYFQQRLQAGGYS